jgi:hypothetical protein
MNEYNHEQTLCNCGVVIPHSEVRLGAFGFGYKITTCPTCELKEEFRKRHLAHFPIKEKEQRPRPDGSPNAELLRARQESYGYFEGKEAHA